MPNLARFAAALLILLALACESPPSVSDGGSTPADAASVDGSVEHDAAHSPIDGAVLAVTISPRARTVRVGTTLALVVRVDGGGGAALVVEEPSGCGTVDDAGTYTAPAEVPDPPVCHVRASALADPSVTDRAALTIVDTASAGTPGVWEDVTPGGISLDPDHHGDGNFGVQDVLVDPARPSDLYAFTTYQGCWRSTDYGLTWTLVSTGRNADVLATGRMWGAAIGTDALRDPATPPTLYTFNGYGSTQGLFRSSDGGVNWDHITLPDGANGDYPQDAYDVDVDPYDARHLVLGYHGSGLSESTDGGDTWRPVPGSERLGGSPYVFFVDTGDAESTARTWLTISQWESNEHGVQRTTDRGATWTRLLTAEHGHGNAQLFNAGDGVVYVTGIGFGHGGIFRSDDGGASFTQLSEIGGNTIIGTPGFLYVGNGWASADGADPGLLVASRSADTVWTPMTTPPAMTNGPKRSAVTFDGTHHIVVNGSWNAGIWRYVEP